VIRTVSGNQRIMAIFSYHIMQNSFPLIVCDFVYIFFRWCQQGDRVPESAAGRGFSSPGKGAGSVSSHKFGVQPLRMVRRSTD